MRRWTFIAPALLLAALPASAAPNMMSRILLEEDFETQSAEWSITAGRGDARVTRYAGNASLNLTRNAAAVRAVPIGDTTRILVSASLAASDLEGSDACLVEFSADGRNWFEIGRIGDGKDDGVTLHRIESIVDLGAPAKVGYIGLRVAGDAANDSCWADNIRIEARTPPGAMQGIIGPDAFEKGGVADTPFSTAAFLRPASARPAARNLSGNLSFAGGAMTHFAVIRDDFRYAGTSRSIATLPPFAIDILQVGEEIVPLKRTPLASSHSDWEWVFSPGELWEEPAGDGVMRAVLPFALVERNANCTHNGLASFRIGKEGDISHLVYQIGSETCAYTQFDAWGAAPVRFVEAKVEGADGAAAAFLSQKMRRIETRPVSVLPDTIANGFGSSEDVRPSAMTLFGYVADNVHYVSDCPTRFGSYGFCDALVLPTYSWAKSLAAGIAAMRLEKLYEGAMQSSISDYVPACAHAGWANVSFADALNMATGHYTSDGHEVDEGSSDMRSFFLAETHAEKIEIACTAFPRREAPGQKFVYRTADTYILGTAINAYLRSRTGNADTDYYRDLLDPIWEQIGLSPLARTTRRTYDEVAQPFSGWGLFLHRSDIAALAAFLQGGGKIEGEALLDQAMFNAALQRNAGERGLRAVVESQRYQHGFWAWNAGPALGCSEDQWIPALSGFGGLSAALMPNGPVYYYVSDGGDFAWRRAAEASNRYRPFCRTKSE